MEWISVNDLSVEIPFSKVCIFDGGNTFWAYLKKVEITEFGRKLDWHILTHENYGICIPTHWLKVTYPSGY